MSLDFSREEEREREREREREVVPVAGWLLAVVKVKEKRRRVEGSGRETERRVDCSQKWIIAVFCFLYLFQTAFNVSQILTLSSLS